MKIQYCSDLHLEMIDNYKQLQHLHLKPAGNILIIAGDFFAFRKGYKDLTWFINLYSPLYKSIYWLPGNHEYYGFSATQADKPLKEAVADNFFLVNNITIREGDINLIFTTLWSHILPENELFCKEYVNDFHQIKFYQRELLRPIDFNYLHTKSLEFLSKELRGSSDGKNIVITHHTPTFQNYPEEYRKSKINNAFAVELNEFISNNRIHTWIYGHSHRNVPEFEIGKTKLVTNQFGYYKEKEHLSFNYEACFDV